MQKYTVYKHTAPNNKVYIGITCRLKQRWGGNGYHYSRQYFGRAILKYGWDNIEHEILFSDLTKEEAKAKEIELIKLYKSNNPDYGYNITPGGDIPWNAGRTFEKYHSDETRKKMSESHKGKPAPSKGCHRSDEFKQKLRDYQYHPILQIDKNGKVVNEFNNIKDVYVKTGVAVSRCLSGKFKTAGGYYWKWKENDQKCRNFTSSYE